MKKSKKPIKQFSRRQKKVLLFSFVAIFILFILYSLWCPSSQIFGKAIYKSSDGIILTFDDGPGPETEQIVKTLEENNITSIFFITCEHVNQNEISTIKKISDSGNIVALHGQNHNYFQKYDEIKQCKEFLENITKKPVVYFRPPYGLKLPTTMNYAKQLNLTVVTWSLFARDYRAESPEELVLKIEKKANENYIICFHDGPENRKNTAEALSKIIDNFKQNNLKISELKK